MNAEEIEQLKIQVQEQRANLDQSLPMNGMETHTTRKYLLLIGLPILLLLIGILILLLYLRLTAEPIETSTQDLQELPSLSTNGDVEGSLVVNIPTVYEGSLTVKQLATFEGGIVSPGLITSISVGTGLASTGGQDPVISNTGVLSLAGETGELDLIAGTGITIDGLTISSTVTEGEDQDVFRTIVSGGVSFSASGANDTLTFTAGDGIELSTNTGSKSITISNTSSTDLLASPDGSGVTSSYSGLEYGGANNDEITLIQGCANAELLKWNTATQMWECGPDIGGLSNAVVNVKESDVLVSSTVDTLDFSGTDFSLTESPAGEINIVIDYASSFITRSNQNEVITGSWEFGAVEVTNGLVVSGGNLNLATGNVYEINGTSVLSNNTLGTGITTSSLTSVGALTSGSIGSGFGSILTTNTITGSTINATTGINTGAGAGTLRINNAGNLVNIGTTQFNGITYTWPGSDAAGSGYVLTSNGSGGLSWQEVSGIGGVGDISAVGDVLSGPAFTTGGSGSTLYFHNSGFEGDLTTATLTGDQTYTLPNSSGTFCLTSGNCSGTGAGIGGSGTTNYVAKFSAVYGITDSTIYDDGNVGIGTATPGYKLDVDGTFNTSGLATFLSGVSVNSETITDFTGSGLQLNAGVLETVLGTDIDLASEVTGVLPVANGGTGANTFTAGGILYGNGTSAVGASSAGTAGQVLTSGGAGSPTWVDASTVGTNYWQQNLGALSPLNTSNDLLLGSNATSSAVVRLPGITGENAIFNLGTGNVGIGTLTPTAGKLQVVNAPGTYASGIQNTLRIEATGVGNVAGDSNVRTLSFATTMTGANNASELTAILGDTFNSKSSGTITTQQGSSVNLRVTNASNTSNAYGFRTIPTLSGAGNINNYRGFEARTPSFSSTGVITTAYGVYIDAHQVTGVTTGYGLYQAGATDENYFAGNVGLGVTNPGYMLDVNGTSNFTGASIFGSTISLGGQVYDWSGASPQNGYILTTDGSGTLTWMDPGTLPNNDLWQRNSGAISPTNITDDVLTGATATSSAIVKLPGLTNQDAFFNIGNGNVGIGNNAPTNAKLDVTGSGYFTGTLGVLGTATNANYGLNVTLVDDQRGLNTTASLSTAADNAYGAYNTLSFSNGSAAASGIIAGTRNDLNLSGNGTSSNSIYGTYNSLALGNANNNTYGTYNSFTRTANGNQFGLYNQFGTQTQASIGYGLYNVRLPATQSVTTQYGMYNDFQNLSTMTGAYNDFDITSGASNTLRGVFNNFTTGATNNNAIYGIDNDFSMTNYGTLYGISTTGNVAAQGTGYGVHNVISLGNSGVGGNLYGVYNDLTNNGGAASRNVYGVYNTFTTANTGNTYGLYADQNSASTNGTLYGVYLNLNDTDTTRWGIYEAGGATNYFAGNVGIGTSIPGYLLDVNGTLNVTGTTRLNTVTYTWPGSQAGGANYVLANDGSGNLSWMNPGTLPNNDLWQRNLGAIAPLNITDDVLTGATATSSAIVRLPGLTGQNAIFNLGTGNVGIGTTTPTAGKLQVVYAPGTYASGIQNSLRIEATGVGIAAGDSNVRTLSFSSTMTGANNASELTAISGDTFNSKSSGTITTQQGASVNLRVTNASNTSNAYGFRIIPTLTGAGNINNYRGFEARTPSISSTGVIATAYGMYIDAHQVTGVTTGYGLYQAGATDTNYFAGNVGIGTTTPTTFKLEMGGSIGPSADDTYDLGSDTRRWRDVYVGPASLHIGNSGDDVTLSYDLVNDRLSINKGIYVDGDAIFNSGTQLNGVDYTWPGADGSNGYILTTDGSGALTWIDPGSLPNNDVWQRNLGAVTPLNVTDDILAGATATSSAIVRIPGLTNQNAWFNLGTGNLGIGTTNPVHKLELASGTAAAEGIGFGTDVELYRSTTNTLALATGDSFNIVSGALQIAGTAAIDPSRNANFASSVTLGADAVLSRGAANRFDLASGDSLNIVSGNLQFAGTTAIDSSRNASFATSLTLGGDAVISRGAANRFDIASGDSLNLVLGSMQIGGTDVITSGRLVLAADGAANAPGFAFASDATNGMFLAGLDQLAFSTAGTESMRILANGNVGIGNTNPGDKLVVNGNISISGTNGSFISSVGDGTPHNDPVYTFIGDTDTGMFRAGTNQLGFSTSGAEAMRILSNGNVGIGVINPGAMLEVEGTVRFTDLTTGTSNLAVCMNSSTGEIIQSSALNCTTSSQRYKSNIQDLDAGLAQVLELRPRSYVRDSSGLTEIGLIAEEVENIDSRLVFYNNEGLIEGVHYENMTALLAKGIQELDAKIATLHSSIPDLVASSSAEFDLGENIEADFAAFEFTSISSDLTVLGTTTLREASIQDTLAVGAGELVITSNSINTLSETLEIQSLSQAPVSIMAGAVTINTDGTVTFAENVEFQKNVAVAGEFTTSQLNIQKSAPTLLSDTEMSASSSAGTAYIKAGEAFRSIQSPLIKSDSLIYITPLSDTLGTTPFISEQKEQDASTSASFTVTIKEEVSEDIHFNFLIIN